MIDQHFVLLGAIFSLLGSFRYMIDTLKGVTQPNRVTWFLWALAPLIAFSAEIQEGVGLGALMTFTVGFGPLVIFISSFVNRKSYWKISRFDILCGSFSLLALVLWRLTGTGTVAIALSIAADALAGVPTIIKIYRRPETESHSLFLFGAISAAITILTIKHWSLATAGFPIYILGICLFMFSLGRYNSFIKQHVADRAKVH